MGGHPDKHLPKLNLYSKIFFHGEHLTSGHRFEWLSCFHNKYHCSNHPSKVGYSWGGDSTW